MAKAFESKELVITMTNEVGVGARVYEMISQTGVNVVATWGYTLGHDAIILIITDDNELVKAKLKEEKVDFEERGVVLTELENKPGAFHTILQAAADAGVSIDYAYATAATRRWALVVVQTNDNAKAVAAMSD